MRQAQWNRVAATTAADNAQAGPPARRCCRNFAAAKFAAMAYRCRSLADNCETEEEALLRFRWRRRIRSDRAALRWDRATPTQSPGWRAMARRHWPTRPQRKPAVLLSSRIVAERSQRNPQREHDGVAGLERLRRIDHVHDVA